MRIAIFIALVAHCRVSCDEAADEDLKDKYDGYGKDWIFMPDGNGQPQVAVLKLPEQHGQNRMPMANETISYTLYTRSTTTTGTPLFLNDPNTLKNSDFQASRKTKFLTHGWKSSTTSHSVTDMKTAYLTHGDYNVITVDWEPLAASTFYLGPMQNTRKVGQDASDFIEFLIKETGLKSTNVHFIESTYIPKGHSLGAHVAGNAGGSMKSGPLGRVTGLDPALPGFHLLASEKSRLDPTDAKFVDVIHSCGGVLGWFQPLGQIDFYPNGGTPSQPGCCCIQEVSEACSHGRSYLYYAESINSQVGLKATKCDTWDRYSNGECKNEKTVLLGEHVDKTASGSYYLKTRSEAPFAYNTNDNDV